jgi:HK97 family phage major capsid protein
MNRSTMQTIATFKDSGGRYVLNPVAAPGAPPNLLGYDVVIAEDMPGVAANTFSIAFGDWKRAYTIADRKGMTIIHDPYSNKPYVGYYCVKRTGGALVNSEAIRLAKFSVS